LDFQLLVLGSGSAAPRLDRRSPAQLITYHDEAFLIDCGEGTQYELLRHGIKVSRISRILISHLHADHCLGLFGLLSTFNLHDRKQALTIHGPTGLSEWLYTLAKLTQTFWKYPLEVIEHDTSQPSLIVDEPDLEIMTIPLHHKLPCAGFLIKERRSRVKLDRDKLPSFLSDQQKAALARSESVKGPDGQWIHPADVEAETPGLRSFAYCSDTNFKPDLCEWIEGVGTLYHEATFASDLVERARLTLHSTGQEAATIADMAKVKELLIGHFSSRYESPERILAEAKEIFSATFAVYDGFYHSIAAHQSFERP
jgi:ribonuclease Z